MKFRNAKILQVVAIGILTLAAVPSAEAVATLRISTNGTDWTSLGTGATVADANGDGVVSTAFSAGIWVVTVSTGISKPLDGSITSPEMHLNVVAVSADLFGNGGSLYVQFSDDSFGPTTGSFLAGFSSTIDPGNSHNSAAYTTLVNTSNALFGGSILTASQGGGPGVASSVSQSGAVDLAAQYSLTQTLVLTHGGGVQTSSTNLDLRMVPEGGVTLSLLGGAMVGMALLRRRIFK